MITDNEMRSMYYKRVLLMANKPWDKESMSSFWHVYQGTILKNIASKNNVEFIDSIPDQGAALNYAIKLADTYRLCVHKVVLVTKPIGEIFAGLLSKSLPKGNDSSPYSGSGSTWGKRLGIYLIVSVIIGFIITIPISYGLRAPYATCLGGGVPLGFLIGVIVWARVS